MQLTSNYAETAAPVPRAGDSAADADLESGFDWGEWLDRYGLRDVPAWGVSLGLHLLVFMMMATVHVSHKIVEEMMIASSMPEVDPTLAFDTVVTDQLGSNSDITNNADGAAVALIKGEEPQTQIEQQITEDFRGPEVKMTREIPQPPTAELTGTIEARGSGTEHPGGTEGAIDRLTVEIAQSLRQRKTVVVWMFDQSLSLKDRRDAIADRFENIYSQLGALDIEAERSLKTAVMMYGEKYSILTPEPVDDVRPLIEKIRKIPNDESGKENVFAAVGAAVKTFQKYRSLAGRNIMLINITDERGDDVQHLEEVVLLCKRAGIRVYTVGNAALFGREQGYVTWTYPDSTKEDLPVDAGPESIYPEALRMPFWGNRGNSLDRMSSGYGPYGLTRLSRETGGLFLVAEEGRGPKFDPAVMRSYSPEYIPIRDYEAQLNKNKAKKALVEAAMKTKVESIPFPQLSFRADTDNALRTQLTEAQRPIALATYKIEEMLTILSQGEKDRDKITEARWKAAYDLAYGRVLAMKARIHGYNKLAAEMKVSPKPFNFKESDQWNLVPSKTITAGPDVSKLAKQATMYLRRVVDEHPDTPWAMMAERELAQNMGWEWQEGIQGYAKMDRQVAAAAAAKKQVQLADDDPKKKPAAMKKAEPPARPKPKL